MIWKQRGNREYGYRSERRGGRVVSVYVGPRDVGGELLDRLERCRRERDRLDRLDERDRAEEDARSGRLAGEAVARSEALVGWALGAAGYHRPKRGPWRRRRMAELMKRGGGPPAIPAPPPSPLQLVGKLERALSDRMMRLGDDESSRGTRRELRDEVLAYAGELAGPDPTPLVRAAAHVAAVCYYDWIVARFTSGTALPSDREAKAIERAERRFHRAARCLEDLRSRMPAVMVAIGRVNIDRPGA